MASMTAQTRGRRIAVALGVALVLASSTLSGATAADSPWTVYPVEVLPEAGTTDQLADVEADSADLAFAVGQSENDPLLVKWNGTSWKEVQFFAPYEADSALTKVHRVSASSWWAIGYSGQRPWIARYKNGAWSHFSTVGLGAAVPVAISTTNAGAPVLLTGSCCSQAAGTAARIARWSAGRWVLQGLPRPAGFEQSVGGELRRIPGTPDRFIVVGETSGPAGDRWASRPWAVRGQLAGKWEDFSPPAAFPPYERGFVFPHIAAADAHVAGRSDITFVGAIHTTDDAVWPFEDFGEYQVYVTRWDGARWSRIKLPSVRGDAPQSMAVHPGKSRMIVGFNPSTRQAVAWEYKPGGSWARLAAPPKDTGLFGVAAIPGTTTYWAVGLKGPAGGLYFSPSDPYVLKH